MQPIGLYQNKIHLITVRVELKTICTVDVNLHAELPYMVQLKWETQDFIRTMPPPADLLQLPFCYNLATNMSICCPINDKMVLSVVSACLIADYLYLILL